MLRCHGKQYSQPKYGGKVSITALDVILCVIFHNFICVTKERWQKGMHAIILNVSSKEGKHYPFRLPTKPYLKSIFVGHIEYWSL